MFKIQGLKFRGILLPSKAKKIVNFILDFHSHIALFSAALDVHLVNFSRFILYCKIF